MTLAVLLFILAVILGAVTILMIFEEKFFLVPTVGLLAFACVLGGLVSLKKGPNIGQTRTGCIEKKLTEQTVMRGAYPVEALDYVCVREGLQVYTEDNRWENVR